MKGMVSQFVLFGFLMLLMWTGVSYVSQNMQYGRAREFFRSAVRQIEDSNFDDAVLKQCQTQATGRGYRLYIRQYKENQRDASVMLTYDYTFPVTQKVKTYTICGFAR
jgi:hypothetical protein